MNIVKKMMPLVLLLLIATQMQAAPKDSIAIMVINNVRYILHRVENKETLYAISRRYSVDVSLLIQLNTLDSVLKEGRVIRIPIKNDPSKPFTYTKPRDERKPIDAPKPEVSQAIYHALKRGETLYSLAKQTPNSSVEKIKQWNKIETDAPIKEGTLLIIGYTTRATAPAPPPKPKEKEPTTPPKPDEASIPTTTNEATEQAVCEWNNNGQLNANRKFALHRSLPTGTILKLTNPANNKIVFVKIVGKLKDDDTTADLLVSKSVADQINADSMRFKVLMAYKKR